MIGIRVCTRIIVPASAPANVRVILFDGKGCFFARFLKRYFFNFLIATVCSLGRPPTFLCRDPDLAVGAPARSHLLGEREHRPATKRKRFLAFSSITERRGAARRGDGSTRNGRILIVKFSPSNRRRSRAQLPSTRTRNCAYIE